MGKRSDSVTIRLSPSERALFLNLAARKSLSLSSWARMVLREEAERATEKAP